jgi:methyl-accepting chemotaxis protein
VKKVSDIVAEIAAASREQSSGIEQVNRAVMQMDEMTQQNGALVEQATAASQAMADQARELNDMMERYRLSAFDVRSEAPQFKPAAAPAILETSSGKAASKFEGVERRSKARPWSGKRDAKSAQPSPSYSASQPRPAPVTADSDTEWTDF